MALMFNPHIEAAAWLASVTFKLRSTVIIASCTLLNIASSRTRFSARLASVFLRFVISRLTVLKPFGFPFSSEIRETESSTILRVPSFFLMIS